MTSLPPLIMTSEPGAYARKTITERKPLIIDKILSDYDDTPTIRNALLALKEELAQGTIQPLHEETSDRTVWDQDLEPWIGRTWLQIPWFLAETFFYRRVLEAVQYFQPGPWMGRDPFCTLKDAEISETLSIFIEIFAGGSGEASLEAFQCACYRALWGNRGDLSNPDSFETDMGAQSDQIVLNQTVEAYQFLHRNPTKIAYFFDNVGKELFFDLAFIDFLLGTNLAKSVTCYLKNQPFFVSDAMPDDLKKTIELMSASQSSGVQGLAQRIKQALRSGTMVLETPPFFTTSRTYHRMPEALQRQIGTHDLTILKGDVNYRRLFGDCHWDPTTTVEEAGGYFPSSFLSLRTLKAEIILGISKETILALEKDAEPGWLINGKRGMITFLEN